MIEFAAFLQAVRGYEPYPWQQSLAGTLAGETVGREPLPPIAITVPTGAGKTTVVDVLVWALAAQAARAPAERTIGVRVVWAIDRRLLVDEVHDHAIRLAARLQASLRDEADPLHEVAVRLEWLKRNRDRDAAAAPAHTRDGVVHAGVPLVATRWRGGLPVPAIAGHPLQAEVITSTVAQIGSRLLFRGYGLGDGSLPVAAALAACDTTICLDEAHLAEPFAETVGAIQRHRAHEARGVAAPLRLIQLSATHARTASAVALSPEDEALPQLARRLRAPKFAALVTPESGDGGQERALVEAVQRYVADGRLVVGCVANSVRTARTVFDRLCAAQPNAVLLIGPQRPADRRRLLASGQPTVADVLLRGRRPEDPLVVVATQTFEVGIDADLDALVTQSASATALTQRLGRLNRSGRLHAQAHASGEADHPDGHATIVRQEGFPLYPQGEEQAAWDWLSTVLESSPRGVDVSVAALRRAPGPHSPPRLAAELSAEIVGLLTQTGPRPAPSADPDLGPFLRGPSNEDSADVTLCWRADLAPEDDSQAAKLYRESLLRCVPPRADEQLGLSVGSARNLLRVRLGLVAAGPAQRARLVGDAPDVDGGEPVPDRYRDGEGRRLDIIPFFVLRGEAVFTGRPRSSGLPDEVSVGQIRPGDRLVLPTAVGGIDRFGLAPECPSAEDVGADVDGAGEVPVPVRLTAGALGAAYAGVIPQAGPRARRVARLMRRAAEAERRRVQARSAAGRRDAIADLLNELADHPAASAFADPDLVAINPLHAERWAELDDGDDLVGDDEDVGDDASPTLLPGEEPPSIARGWVLIPVATTAADRLGSDSRTPPTLNAHAAAVGARTHWFADAAGVPHGIAQTLVLAARVHDHGKADPRMQAFFRGGHPLPGAAPLAKSTFGTDDRAAAQMARRAAGLPRRWRHELESAAIFADAWVRGPQALVPGGDPSSVDPELAVHLISTHHGRCLPLPPRTLAGAPGSPYRADVDGIVGVSDGQATETWDGEVALHRLEVLAARYGPWTLAFLQALLVLADRTVSAEGG
ncbi:MAG TPA: type I-U CRISPR-associated helicase/endonuclease Cas3 [Solirubrobacteraceae bacterium]|jgi:CRISPR-associated endonuclease/helicase Cas3|nr:type I-U CRISPR-associated helicase/endonuclease Cas3 [Solirubrobacteraceae bacterium]